MPYKLTIFFADARRAWTEAYLNNADLTPTSGNPEIVALINARAALLGTGASIFNVRTSSFPANKRVQNFDPSAYTHTGSWPPSAQPNQFEPANDNLALLIRTTTPVGTKLIYIAGLPGGVFLSDAVAGNGLSPGSVQTVTPSLNAFTNRLILDKWGCRSWKSTVLTPAIGLQQGPQTPPLIGVQLATNPGWALNSKVLLGGWRRANPRSPGLTGVYTLAGVPLATQVVPPYVYYLYGTANVSPSNFKTIGSIGLVVYSVAQFTAAQVDKATTRKRGGRVALPLGRFSRVR